MKTNESENTKNNFNLYIDENGKENLQKIGKWSKVLAIAAIIYVFITIFQIYIHSIATNQIMEFLLYLLLVVAYVIPFLFLWKFSNYIKVALKTSKQQQFNIALNSLKTYSIIFAILTIIGIIALVINLLIGI